jgi:hypothetical protein
MKTVVYRFKVKSISTIDVALSVPDDFDPGAADGESGRDTRLVDTMADMACDSVAPDSFGGVDVLDHESEADGGVFVEVTP